MTTLECLSCGYRFPSNQTEFTNIDIAVKFFTIYWNCPKCNTEGWQHSSIIKIIIIIIGDNFIFFFYVYHICLKISNNYQAYKA